MATLWIYRIFLILALPSLALLSVAIGTQLPHAVATQSPDAPGLVAWAVAVLVGIGLVVAAVRQKRRGRVGMAATLVGIVAMPAAFGLAMFLLIVALFIAKG